MPKAPRKVAAFDLVDPPAFGLFAERRDLGQPEPARDPNRLHHATALVQQMDRAELYALGQLVLERLHALQLADTIAKTPKRKKKRGERTTTIDPRTVQIRFEKPKGR